MPPPLQVLSLADGAVIHTISGFTSIAGLACDGYAPRPPFLCPLSKTDNCMSCVSSAAPPALMESCCSAFERSCWCCCSAGVPETQTLTSLLICRVLIRLGRALVSDSAAGRVAVLDGSFAEVGSLGGSGGLSSPAGIAAGSDGWVYVTEAGRARVAIFDEALGFVGSFPAAPVDGASGECPRAIEVLNDATPAPRLGQGLL